MKTILDKGMQHYYQWLDDYTLADAVQEPTRQAIMRLSVNHSPTH